MKLYPYSKFISYLLGNYTCFLKENPLNQIKGYNYEPNIYNTLITYSHRWKLS